MAAARRRAYEAAELIRFPGRQMRTDIGAPDRPGVADAGVATGAR
jgi:phosphoribosylamine-glycine ligase